MKEQKHNNDDELLIKVLKELKIKVEKEKQLYIGRNKNKKKINIRNVPEETLKELEYIKKKLGFKNNSSTTRFIIKEYYNIIKKID